MASVSGYVTTGVLGSAIGAIYTALGIEYVGAYFRNSYTAAASSFTARMWYSGTADRDIQFNTIFNTGEALYWQGKMRSGDILYASSSTGSAMSYNIETDRLA